MLAIFKYAPRCSRFNPIERAWSKMTKDLSNLILDPDCEIISKDHASTALQHEKINIEKFREVNERVASVLEDFNFDNWDWTVGKIDPTTQHLRIDRKGDIGGIESTTRYEFGPDSSSHDKIHSFFSKKLSKKNKQKLSGEELEMYKKNQYYSSHCDQRSHLLVFQRCDDSKCQPCVQFFTKHNTKIPRTIFKDLNIPTLSENSAMWFEPQPDPEHPESYKTLLQTIEDLKKTPKIEPEICLPEKAKFPCNRDCLMWFKSNAALERHKNLVHTEGHDNQNLRNKKCPKCDVLYPSQYYLNRHLRDDHGHVPTKGRGRPKKSQN